MDHILTISRHHNCEVGPFDVAFSCEDGADETTILAFALYTAVQEELCDLDEDGLAARCREAVEQAIREGSPGGGVRLVLPMVGGHDEFVLSVWYDADQDSKLGYGESEDGTVDRTDKHENRWLQTKPLERIAAIVDYVCDQNCPSTPLLQLYRIPHDIEARNKKLRELWQETFDVFGHSDEGPVVDESPPYGDLSVGDGQNFLIVQYMQTNRFGEVEVL